MAQQCKYFNTKMLRKKQDRKYCGSYIQGDFALVANAIKAIPQNYCPPSE